MPKPPMGIKDGGNLILFIMRPDFDLQFLENCENEDLRILCDILMYDNNGEIRISESLSNSDSYISYYPNNMKGMWKDIASELQCYGGNTVLNICRCGQGPKYESIVYDVCKKMKVKGISKHDTAEDMEQKLLITLSSKAISEMTEEQVRSIMEECGIIGYAYSRAGLVAALLALQVINKRLFIIVIHSVMRMLSEILLTRGIVIIGMGTLSRGLGVLLGPICWIMLTGWTVWDLMGPAYRVTVPAVVQIACMRVKFQASINQNSHVA
jgi:uncharacterized protein YaaW (UPF0174 family)